MSVDQINRALRQLVIPNASNVPRGHTVFAANVTQEQWDAFLESEDQAFKSTYMTRNAVRGDIHITEFPSKLRDAFRLNASVRHSLMAYGASYNSTGPLYEPDLSYGPSRDSTEPLGAVLPPGVPEWGDFVTLKIDIGVTQTWAQLDANALNVWANTPGVAYMLSIQLDEDLQHASYTLYQVSLIANQAPLAERPIVAPSTEVHLDAHLLLGLPAIAALPTGFPDRLEIDLFAPLVQR